MYNVQQQVVREVPMTPGAAISGLFLGWISRGKGIHRCGGYLVCIDLSIC